MYERQIKNVIEKSIIEKYIYMKIMKPASMRVEAGFAVD